MIWRFMWCRLFKGGLDLGFEEHNQLSRIIPWAVLLEINAMSPAVIVPDLQQRAWTLCVSVSLFVSTEENKLVKQ